jgi:uncharacterized protein YjiK
MKRLAILILLNLFIGSLLNFNYAQSTYNIKFPDAKLILPDTLHEISGLTEVDANKLACIQDENGIIFIYDIRSKKTVAQIPFAEDGDYEGIARVNETLYVLRSDGVLFQIKNFMSSDKTIKSYQTGVPASNNEGLCYDPQNNRLLIAAKGKAGKGPKYKNRREIYSFDLKTMKLDKGVAICFDVENIASFAVDNGIKLPVRVKKKGEIVEPVLKFTTSAIAIHPITKELYLLSSTDHLLMVFDIYGQIKYIEKLDEFEFNKPEGIIFLQNGDMLISNEGQDHHPTLLRFNYNSVK